MKIYKELRFDKFLSEDVELFTMIMKRAFDEDAKRHLNEPEGGPPGYDNGEFLRKYALNEKSQSYKVYKGTQPIGVFIVWINENNENFLGNMFVDPEVQDKGLGSVIWEFIEKEYPETRIWRTETPGFSKRNHYFYVNKCGFKIVRIDKPENKYKDSYYLEKEMIKLSSGLPSCHTSCRLN